LFVNEALKTHFETSATIKLQSLILAEWNMNMPDNIFYVGNYRYRPTDADLKFKTLPIYFDQLDAGDYYTDATDSEVSISGGVDDEDSPQLFTSIEQKRKLLYSLEDCLKPFRPRSGINKPLFFRSNKQYLANSGASLAQRPRYYMSSRYDQFKYWNSYRKEEGLERGIAKVSGGQYYIDDAVPFVVYKEEVPANRLVVKMQTNVGDIDLAPFTNFSSTFADPLYGDANKTTPKRWKIQYLKNNSWIDAYSFDENSTRADGTAIIKSDGYVELEYGLIIPDKYKDTFVFAETYSSETLLPELSINGYAYFVLENESTVGEFFVWSDEISDYETFVPEYGWTLGSESLNARTSFVKELVSPFSFVNPNTSETRYREFEYIKGIRVVAETMNKDGTTFDLIEMSPRLVADISDSVIEYTVRKSLSDLGNTSLPVGQLLASTGTISIFDTDQAFNTNNTNSIIAKYLRKNIKFNFYEQIADVGGIEYYDFVPIKTLYSEGIPQSDVTAATLSLELRDFYFFLESMPAPRMLVTEVSLSYAISLLLDYIGFANYSFKRIDGESDPIIPYFFIAPDQNVAEVLNQLAISTQTSMFFDEYNNFIVMSKDYLMPSESMRSTDLQLIGNNDQSVSNIIENQTGSSIPNIIAISSQDKQIFNDGKINYTTRYIQRSYGSIRQASMIDKEKTWIYKPALLWEVSGTNSTKTINELASKQGSYVLGAMPLNSNLSDSPPTVANGIVINNIIDLGENIYWLTRYQGYFYSNGEIIRYDAAQFNITGTGNVWISSNQEYQKYFASLPFNGKIYPTGLIRIFSTPYYELVNDISRLQPGNVYEHGRAQFGTQIASHFAGINSYWSNNDYVRGCNMSSEYLFTTEISPTIPQTTLGAAGTNNVLARQTSRNSIIKNSMATNYLTETEVNDLKSTQSGTIQSSALVINGPSFKSTDVPINFVSYVYKNLDNAYKHFGTRLRIIGKIENSETRSQTPIGSMPYYQISGVKPNQSTSIGGGSGGLAVMLNPETNNGYYFEIIALTENNVESYLNLDKNNQSNISINNIVFYKVKKDQSSDKAIPIKLWGGLSKILVDDGRFAGQYRMSGEESSTVYDLSVEYQTIGSTRRFFLYLNNQLIKVVDDTDPLPIYNNMALFTRGSSRCMFENIYALSENYAENPNFTVADNLSTALGNKEVSVNESFRRYAMSGIVQATYLSGISSQQPPKFNMYFEEFGSIMRECAYFNIKYDRAYPALYAQLSPTFNSIKGYTTSGFYANSYGAEFLIFNSTDSAINLDETTGNYLRIQGITFTQDTTHELSVDEYFKKRGNLSDPPFVGSSLTYSPLIEKNKYDEIKLSRLIYGKNEFSINTPYIQTQDDAEALMGWVINKVMSPKKSVGVKIFATPTIQLGDIVTIDYKDSNGLDLVASTDDRFVVYNIEYSRSSNGPDMTIYLNEV
jgi:hypothetical protein